MSIKNYSTLATIIVMLFAACNSETGTNANKSQPISIPQPNINLDTIEDGNYCFLFALNKDSTFVNLTINGNTVSGGMHWQPYQKDGAIGILNGKTNDNGEFELLYDYMIEGSQQTETKIMKIENGKLLIKKGELLDPQNDGHLIYKDVSNAVYLDTLNQTDCK